MRVTFDLKEFYGGATLDDADEHNSRIGMNVNSKSLFSGSRFAVYGFQTIMMCNKNRNQFD